MKRFLLLLILIPSLALSQNPIIPGFHPDPSIVRVGEYYYIVNSSFHYFPGVPIHRSSDLRHWELIGNVLDRDSQLPLGSANSWQGIFAPTIRYNDGIYYMVTTNVSVGRNFFVTATDPAGPWSEPIWLDQGGIDPSFYFEGGRCYLVSNPDNSITLCEIDPSSGRQLSPSKVIWRGTGGRYPEGPHIYHKDGWYYLLISEGGTEMAHSLTIARSRNIDGPYKPGPSNPILTHCSLAAQDSPIQGTGHGDFVQSPDGSWHVVFLAYRRFGGDYHHLGRETFIAPVTWLSGWPVINDGHPIALDLAATPVTTVSTPPFTGPEWVHIQNPERDNYTRIGSALVLRGNGSSLTTGQHPTYLGRRQEGPDICLDATLTALTDSTIAGIAVYQIDGGHLDLGFESDTTLTLRYQLKSINHLAAYPPPPPHHLLRHLLSSSLFLQSLPLNLIPSLYSARRLPVCLIQRLHFDRLILFCPTQRTSLKRHLPSHLLFRLHSFSRRERSEPGRRPHHHNLSPHHQRRTAILVLLVPRRR